jgi:hypothetical protein
VVAVALGGTEPVGIDVEFMAPGRPIGAVVQFLLKAPGPPAFDDARAYRAWTFAEAHFKAFGALPEPGLLRIVLRAEARWGEPYAPQPGMRALHSAPASDFTMSVVWAGDGAPEAVSL